MEDKNKEHSILSLKALAQIEADKSKKTDEVDKLVEKKKLIRDIREHVMSTFDMHDVLFCTDKEFLDGLRVSIASYLLGSHRLLGEKKVDALTEYMIEDMTGLGPLEKFRVDSTVKEIKVVRYDRIYVYTTSGGKVLTDSKFDTEEDLQHVIEKIAKYNNKAFNLSYPRLSCSLPGKMRVHALHSVISLNGCILNIRKFPKRLSFNELVENGACPPKVAMILTMITMTRKTFAACGPTGSGKTTLGMALYDYAPRDLSIITIEDTPEFQLLHQDWRPLVTREANFEGRGEENISALIADCMRLTPDVIIIGEIRKAKDAYEMLQAFHTGHKGSFITIHASSAKNFVTRLAQLLIDSGRDISLTTAKQLTADAFDYVVFQEREIVNSKTKREKQFIKEIAEVTGFDEKTGEVIINNIFEWKDYGFDKDGNKIGELKATGYIPEKLFEACKNYDIRVKDRLFDEQMFRKMFLSE